MYSISFFQVSGNGARDLWGTLRNNSQIKLQKQDNMIPPDVKVMVLSYGRGECDHNNDDDKDRIDIKRVFVNL